MAKKTKNDRAQYVRKETFWLGTLLALAVGFFGGVMFAVFKSDTGVVAGTPQAQVPQAQVATPGRSNMIASLEDETAKNPQNTKAWVQLGNEYFDSDQYEKAIWAYRKSLDLDPNNANVWTDLGVMYRRSGSPQEAIKSFDKAIEVDPLYKLAYNQLAYTYDRIGNFEKSIWAINKYISIAPDEPNPYDTRGDLYGGNGKIDLAIKSYEKALEIKPDFKI